MFCITSIFLLVISTVLGSVHDVLWTNIVKWREYIQLAGGKDKKFIHALRESEFPFDLRESSIFSIPP